MSLGLVDGRVRERLVARDSEYTGGEFPSLSVVGVRARALATLRIDMSHDEHNPLHHHATTDPTETVDVPLASGLTSDHHHHSIPLAGPQGAGTQDTRVTRGASLRLAF